MFCGVCEVRVPRITSLISRSNQRANRYASDPAVACIRIALRREHIVQQTHRSRFARLVEDAVLKLTRGVGQNRRSTRPTTGSAYVCHLNFQRKSENRFEQAGNVSPHDARWKLGLPRRALALVTDDRSDVLSRTRGVRRSHICHSLQLDNKSRKEF